MQIGAIVTLAGGRGAAGDLADQLSAYASKEGPRFLAGTSRMLVDVLGQSLLERTFAKLRKFGTTRPSVISEGPSSSQFLPSRSAKTSGFIAAWESAVGLHVRHGVELLLLIRMSTYTDLDYSELLEFHREKQTPLTQAYGVDGSLDIALVDAAYLRDASGAYRKALSALIPQQQRFFYREYVNRLNKPQDFRKLVEDGLRGNCGLSPVGVEVQPQVWYGHSAQVDRSAVVKGPAFIGPGSSIGACCVVTGASAIERNCEIDLGTTVDQSCVLQDSYVGVGLDVRRSIVSNKKLFHLDRNVEVSIGDRKLIGVTSNRGLRFPQDIGGFLGSELQWAD